MSAKFAGGNVLNANKLVSPILERANNYGEELIRHHLVPSPQVLFDTLQLRKGVPFNAGKDSLFSGVKGEQWEDPNFRIRTNVWRPQKLEAPQEMEIQRVLIAGDPRKVARETLEEFQCDHTINLWIGQRRYFHSHLRLSPEVDWSDCTPALWIEHGQSFYATFEGPDFTPREECNIVFGLKGTLYAGVC